MGILNFFRFKAKHKPEQPKIEKIDTKGALDEIQKAVFSQLKPLGFKRKGRTFTKEVEKGIFQVINFQAGQFPLGDKYVVPGLRENLYGKFVVNLGVCIDSLYKFNSPSSNQTFYKEYECQIRARLGSLLKGNDYWWPISSDNEKVVQEIVNGLLYTGNKWFAGVDTKDKIIASFGYPPYTSTPRAKLDVALIVWFDNKEKGQILFNEYYSAIPVSKNGHKEYVAEIAKEIGIEVISREH